MVPLLTTSTNISHDNPEESTALLGQATGSRATGSQATGSNDVWYTPPASSARADPTTALWGQTGPASDASPFSSGTDTDTESSDGVDPIEYDDIPAHFTEEQKGEFLYFAMRHAKRRWRRYMK